MTDRSRIEWTDATWNPVTGCDKVSQGCKHCYAETMANRLQAMGSQRYRNGFRLTLQPDALGIPLRWKRPRTIFVNSMSDLFHKDVPSEFIGEVFQVMRDAHWHRFQVLTKRADRMAAESLRWPRNVWAGVSVESSDHLDRVDRLREVDALTRFLSCEPLLGSLSNLNVSDIDWVIVGGESGPGARPMHVDWARDIRDKCAAAGVPFFFKQWGGVRKKEAGRLLDGETHDAMPNGEG